MRRSGKGTEEEGLDRGEDGGIEPDRDRHRENDDRREERILDEKTTSDPDLRSEAHYRGG
jgi:hypothetical protein